MFKLPFLILNKETLILNFKNMHMNKSIQIFGQTQCKYSFILLCPNSFYLQPYTLTQLKRRHNVNGINICIYISNICLFSRSDDSLRKKKSKQYTEIEVKEIIVVTETLTHVQKMRSRWELSATSKTVEEVLVQCTHGRRLQQHSWLQQQPREAQSLGQEEKMESITEKDIN